MEALKRRYPDIAFLLSMFPYQKGKMPNDQASFLEWFSCQNMNEIELLYIGGLLGFPLPNKVLKWLEEKKERALVFLENDLGAFASFKEESLFDHPQIHFHYFENPPYETLAESFPTAHLAIYLAKKIPIDPETLMRKSASISALFSDVLYSHYLVENVLTNYKRLDCAFAANSWKGAFKGVAAVICGAGPSLEKALPTLQKYQDRALIFGCGSAITILSRHGISPHFAMALDPNKEEMERLCQSFYFTGPFLFAPRLHHEVFATTSGPFGFLKTDTGGLVENWLEKQCGFEDVPIGPDLGPEAFSVTTLAISYAYALGCDPIILDGVDLSFTEGKHYAFGIELAAHAQHSPSLFEKRMIRKDIHGKDVETLLTWVMEADAISAFAKTHPDTRFLNGTNRGIGFAGIENISLKEALARMPTQDLLGRIHQMIQQTPLYLKKEKVEELISQLEHSMIRCEKLCNKLLKVKGGKQILYRSDLEEEPAFQALLSGIDSALDRILPRYHPTLNLEEGKKKWEEAKYQELLFQIRKFSKILHKQIAYSSAS